MTHKVELVRCPSPSTSVSKPPACQRLSRATFDLTTAERLRFLAADLRSKAEAVEDDHFRLHMVQGNGFAGSNGANSRD